MADPNNSVKESSKDEDNDSTSDSSTESNTQLITRLTTQLETHLETQLKKHPCLKYANRRRCVFKGDSMNDLPENCSNPIGKKCKHGEHRDWNDGEYEQYMDLRTVNDIATKMYFREYIPDSDVVLTSRATARAYLWKHRKQKLTPKFQINFPIYGIQLLRGYDMMNHG